MSRPAKAAAVLQDLYDSEINFAISIFSDAGFGWKLGDELNGYKAEGHVRSLIAAADQLRDAAIKHFPECEFAAKYKRAEMRTG